MKENFESTTKTIDDMIKKANSDDTSFVTKNYVWNVGSSGFVEEFYDV